MDWTNATPEGLKRLFAETNSAYRRQLEAVREAEAAELVAIVQAQVDVWVTCEEVGDV